MKRALVVVDDTDAHRALLEEAGELADGVGSDLVLFTWITSEEYEDGAEALEAAASVEQTSYSGDALDAAKNFARKSAREVLGDDADVDVTAAVSDDDLADEILAAAEREDCDHVFIVGRRRSPTGKVIFGDVAQRVILNFDGPVTVKMD